MEAKEIAKMQELAVEQESAEKEAPLTLVEFMTSVIGQLKAEKKHPAVRTYTSTMNSFRAFVEEEAAEKVVVAAVEAAEKAVAEEEEKRDEDPMSFS